jgi:hypothetical protein
MVEAAKAPNLAIFETVLTRASLKFGLVNKLFISFIS